MVEVLEKNQPILRKRLKPSEFGPWTVDKKFELNPKTMDTIANKHKISKTKSSQQSSQRNGLEKSYQKLSNESVKTHSINWGTNKNVLMNTALKMTSSQTPSPPFVKSKLRKDESQTTKTEIRRVVYFDKLQACAAPESWFKLL